ncbi:MAG: hypothetical protein ACK5RL_15175 [Acidimicrobiales bacterium]
MTASLRVLTWNLALLARSAAAPVGWRQDQTEERIREEVVALRPDLIAYQELPGLVPYVDTHDMVRANPASHSGNLATLLTHRLMSTEPPVRVVPHTAVLTTVAPPELDGATPVAATPVTVPPVTVANVHLAPGPGNEADRFEQLAAVVAASPTERLAVVGDTNTRARELDALAGELGLQAPELPGPTWDSRRNRFHVDGVSFVASFTRVLVAGGVSATAFDVRSVPLEVDGHRFHLSDHYALAATLRW